MLDLEIPKPRTSKKANNNGEPQSFCELGKAVISTEAEAINNLLPRIDDQFALACKYLLECQGRIIVIGMGKSGHIGNKIAATFASTGSPAFFVHPGEASHGDMGMITSLDVVLALSNSGNTEEIMTLLPIIKRLHIPLITLTGNSLSPIAQAATVNIDVSVKHEACPLGLAPTASTAAALAMGDALAIALLQARGFTKEDFARSHPGGKLGRRLLLRVSDVMYCGDAIPIVKHETLLRDAIIEMSQKKLGMTTILDNESKLVGIYTDGDLRRTLDQDINVYTTPIHMVMTTNYKKIHTNLLAVEALQIMEKFKITSLVVIDQNDKLAGIVHMHAILDAGVI